MSAQSSYIHHVLHPVMNKLGYDAMALGNHEWDFGHDRLVEFARSIDFPILAGNFESGVIEEDNADIIGTRPPRSTVPIKPYVAMNLSPNITLCLLGMDQKQSGRPFGDMPPPL